MSRSIPRAVGAVALAAAFLVGCNKSETTSPPSEGTPKGPTAFGKGKTAGPAKDGKEVFQNHGCMRCHVVNGEGGKKGKGPDLTQVAADAAHTKEWLIAYIKNPKDTNPTGHMPGFAGKITDEEFAMLGDYLAGLK